MKKIGLLGGMSPVSTWIYYQSISEHIRQANGGTHTGEICVYSLDFKKIARAMHQGDWDGLARYLNYGLKQLESTGVDFLAICCNSAHKVWPQLSAQIPILHILIPVGEAIKMCGIKKVGIIGTQFVMNDSFYGRYLKAHYGIDNIPLSREDIKEVNECIYNQLCKSKDVMLARLSLLSVINRLKKRGSQGIVLGCTELICANLENESPLPLFDSTRLHINAIVQYAMNTTQQLETA